MRLPRYFAKRAVRYTVVPISWTAIACTFTTDLDFVGSGRDTSENKPDARAQGKDASVSDTPGTSDASASSLTTETALVTSSSTSTASESGASESDPSLTNTTTLQPDAALVDAGSLDASSPDSGRDASLDASPTDAGECIRATTWLAEGYEGDLSQWSVVNWQNTECQDTTITTALAVERDHSVRTRIECVAETDHLHFTSLQLSDEAAQDGYTPQGIFLSFWAWMSVGYDFDADKWLDFVRVTRVCDLSADPLAVSLNSASRQVAITNGAGSPALSEPELAAPSFALATWTQIQILVDPAVGSMTVWQDGALVSSALFESDGSPLCQVEFGTMASRLHSDLVTFFDGVRLYRLNEPLLDPMTAPTFCPDG